MSKKNTSLKKCTRKLLKDYFQQIGDVSQARDIYTNIIVQVEKPMLKMVMQQAGGNKSKAAKMLGINRNTLHKKLIQHEIN
jgi:Fis family transcriptional regulator